MMEGYTILSLLLCLSAASAIPSLVRLASSDGSTNRGRVEVYANGQWGTVCDDDWGQNDADVVCRELGFTGASSFMSGFTNLKTFGPGSERINLGSLECVGNETSILNCPMGVRSKCSHFEDAGVICNEGSIGASSGPVVRLAGSDSSDNQGRVEVYADGEWGTVCDDLWGKKDADVVCRELGFPGASDFTTRAKTFGMGSGPIHLGSLECVGDETSILYCPMGDRSTCSHFEDAGVICNVVRLAGSDNIDNQGRVEVKVDGEWGTVCDDGWGQNDADVVCRELGFPGADRFTSGFTSYKTFGLGSGPTNLGSLECVGDEPSILNCPMGVRSKCSYFENAGVICNDKLSGERLEVEEEEDADMMKKDILMALADLLAELKDK